MALAGARVPTGRGVAAWRGSYALNLRALLFGVLACALLLLDHRSQGLGQLRGALLTVAQPLQMAVDAPPRTWNWLRSRLASHAELDVQLQRLHTENLRLRLRLQAFDALIAENRRLANMLDSVAEQRLPGRVLVARVIGVELDPYAQRLEINKGAQHGVYQGQAVLDAHGVLGQVVHVGNFTAQVLLITDPSHGTPVMVIRNGLRAIAIGGGPSGLLELPFLPKHVDLRIDDQLATSGLGGVYPPDYPIGRVTAIERETGSEFARVLVAPTGHTDRVHEALLIWPPDGNDAPTPDPAPPEAG